MHARMRHLLAIAIILLLANGAGFAQEWRTSQRFSESNQMGSSQRLSRSVRLGKPIKLGKPRALGTVAHQDKNLSRTKLEEPKRKLRQVVRAQGPDLGPPIYAGPGGAEESYNYGVVTEGPPSENFFMRMLSAPRRWWDSLVGRGPTGLHGESWFAGPLGGGYGVPFESDHNFDSYSSPVSNPFFFEDPRALTEFRPIVMYQRAPGDNPVFRGGDIEFYGAQARLAFNEQFSVVLHKIGYLAIQPDATGPGALGDNSGFSEIQVGPKWTFWRDDVTNSVAAVGLNLEFATGPDSIAQGTGDGSATPYFSIAKRFLDFHVMGTAGYRWGYSDDRSDSFFVSAHIDYSIFDRIYPMVELNWVHYTDAGRSRPLGFEGADLFNFGSTGVSGNDFLSLAAGARFKITEGVQAGFAFEFPLTGRKDLMDYRLTADLIFRY